MATTARAHCGGSAAPVEPRPPGAGNLLRNDHELNGATRRAASHSLVIVAEPGSRENGCGQPFDGSAEVVHVGDAVGKVHAMPSRPAEHQSRRRS
jgi:hypothetical protein